MYVHIISDIKVSYFRIFSLALKFGIKHRRSLDSPSETHDYHVLPTESIVKAKNQARSDHLAVS